MGIPYEMPPMSGLKVTAGVSLVVTVPFPSRTRIYKVLVDAVDTSSTSGPGPGGGGPNFTVELYNNEVAANGGDNFDANGNPIPPSSYLLAPPLPSSGGKMHFFTDTSHGGAGIPFFNQDPPTAYRTVNKRRLYVRITSDVDATFSLAMGSVDEKM